MREVMVVGSSVLLPPYSSPPPHRHLHRRLLLPIFSLGNSTKHSPSPPSPSPPPLLTAVQHDASRLKYYADLASKLAYVGRLEHFLMISESIVASDSNPCKYASLLNVELVSAGISEAIRRGRLRSVVEMLSSIESLGISPSALFDGRARESTRRECCRIVKSGDVKEAVELMEILAGFSFSVKELTEPLQIIRTCVNKRDPATVIRYACILPYAHIVLCTVIHEFGKKKDLVSALAAFEASKLKFSGPNMYAYRIIIDVCGLSGDYIKSRHIYEELLAEDFTPNIYVFNSLMSVNAHDLSYVLHIYQEMKNMGVTPDVASYNIILKACGLAGRVDLAQDIYKDVKYLESTGELKLDLFTYSTIIKVLADAKLWQVALRIKQDMLSAGVNPNTVTWSSLISACASAGVVEPAIQLFNEMLLAGCQPNSWCCNILLHACVEACQYDRAFRLFSSWKKGGLTDAFIEGCIDNGNSVTSMTNIVPKSNSPSFAKNFPFAPTTATYNILMKACGSDYYRAKALMDEMKTMGLSPNHISWSILINIHGGSGNVERAIQILETMREAGIQPDVIAYTAAIKVCVETKNLNTAFSLYTEMRKSRVQPNLVTYNTLLQARSRYGSLQEVQQCLAIYQDMRKAGYKSNDYFLKILIEEWCEGVLRDGNQNQRQISSLKRTDSGGPQSLLVEKVGIQLQKSAADSLVIDIQGLTQIEARIIILAVLWKVKENYALGDPINNDMVIILGTKEANKVTDTDRERIKVSNAMTELLRNELGLEVLLLGSKVMANNDNERDMGGSLDSATEPKENGGLNRIPTELRRPTVLERLKVTKKSLYQWLKRRMGTSTR